MIVRAGYVVCRLLLKRALPTRSSLQRDGNAEMPLHLFVSPRSWIARHGSLNQHAGSFLALNGAQFGNFELAATQCMQTAFRVGCTATSAPA